MITLSEFFRTKGARDKKKRESRITAGGLGKAALAGAGTGSLVAATVPVNMPDRFKNWITKPGAAKSKNVIRRNLAQQANQSLVKGVKKGATHLPLTSYPGATLAALTGAGLAGGYYLGKKLLNKRKKHGRTTDS